MAAFISAAISIALTVVSFVVQQKQASKAKNAARRAQEEADARADASKGFQIVTESKPSVVPVVYGRAVVGGSRVYHKTFNNYVYAAPGANGQVFKASDALDSNGTGSKHEWLITQQVLCIGGINACYDVDVDRRKIAGEYINEYNEVVLNVNPNNLPVGVTKVEPYAYGAMAYVYKNGGAPDPLMTANEAVRASAFFTNCAFATNVFKLNRDDPQFSGVPEGQFYIEGALVHDIVESGGVYSLSANKVYSTSPPLHLVDYLTNPSYGRGLAINKLDLASFYKAARICERVVQANVPLEGSFWNAKGGTRNVYLYENCQAIDTSKTIRENIELIKDTMNDAELLWSGGVYKLKLEYPLVYSVGSYNVGQVVQYQNKLYRSLTNGNTNSIPHASWADAIDFYLDDNTILRDGETSLSWPNAQTRLNFATVRFLNEAKDFQEDTVSWPPKTGIVPGPSLDRGEWNGATAYNISDKVNYLGAIYQLSSGTLRVSAVNPVVDLVWVPYAGNSVYATYLAEDSGLPLETEIFVTGITSYYNALAKAEYLVRNSRSAITYSINVDRTHIGIEPGDFGYIESDVYGISGDLIRATEVRPDDTGKITLSAVRYNAADLAWNIIDDEIVASRLIYNNALAQVTGLTFYRIPDVLAESSGRLAWLPSNDIRVTSYSIKYTRTEPQFITSSTVWLELGQTTSTAFDLPRLLSGSFTLTVVSMSNSRAAPFLNSDGSVAWPVVGVGFSSTVIGGTTLQSVTVYKRSSSPPLAPVGGVYDITALQFNTLPVGWTVTPPTGVNPLYSSTTIVAGTSVNTVITIVSWETPILLADTSSYALLSKPVIGILQDSQGNNFGYSNANGRFIVISNNVDVTQSVDLTFSVLSSENIGVFVDNNIGLTRGNYAVSSLTGNQGYAILRATYLGVHSDRRLTVASVPVGYVLDPSPPSEIPDATIFVDYSLVSITLTTPLTYSEGNGHLETDVYMGVGANLPFLSCDKLTAFSGPSVSFIGPLASTITLWLRYRSKDNGVNEPVSFQATIGALATAQIAAEAITEALLSGGVSSAIALANANASEALAGLITKLTNGASNVLSVDTELKTSGYDGGNGVAITDNGIVAQKNAVSTFVIESDGTATFGGALSAATGSFSGSLTAVTGSFGAVTVGAAGSIASNNFTVGGSVGWRITGGGLAEFRNLLIKNASGNTVLDTTGLYWSSVVGAGKPADNATADLTLIPTSDGGTCVVLGNNVTKTSAAAMYDCGAYSIIAYSSGVMCSFQSVFTNKKIMAGLNTDPALNSNYTSLDYAFYLSDTGSIQIYEGGASKGSFGTYTTETLFSIAYDNITVKYYVDNILTYVSVNPSVAPGLKLYFDSAFNSQNGQLYNINLSPFTNNNWGSIGGVGKPEDNATVGAQIGGNLTGQISGANISTYLAPAVVTDDFIGSVSIPKLLAGNLAVGQYIRSTAYSPGVNGWAIAADGTAEFRNVLVRGDVQATSLNAATGTFAGALSAATGQFAGQLTAATGTFAGSLSAATGTFSGTLTANAINAVSTINLAGNAVTIPVAAYSAGVAPMAGYNVVQSISISSSGGPVYVLCSMLASNGYSATVWIRRDGNILYESSVTPVPYGGEPGGSYPLAWSASIVDIPGFGFHTYDIYVFTAIGVELSQRSILLLETKR